VTRAADRPEGLTAYIAVTAAYWAFMLTDGALRMLVLLHFHTLGFSPVQLAWLFVLYEIAGMVTNLCAGWIAARFGLTSTLYAGLGLQVVALVALAQLDPGWAVGLSVVYVMLVQGASGVAKDLAKMSSKSAVKVLAPTARGGLFRWVAVLTGSKNAVKGLGFLLGAALLGGVGFTGAVLVMAAVLAVILLAVALFMPSGLPTGRKGAKFAEVLSKSANVNRLSAARVFLFGARDVWFVVGLPVYFYAVLSDGSEAGDRAAFFMVGSFMAVWIILYGGVQAAAPRLLQAERRPEGELVGAARGWALGLMAVPVVLTGAALAAGQPQTWLTVTLLPDPRLHQGRARDHGRRFLLHGQRGWAAAGHGDVRADLPTGRPAADAGHGLGNGRAECGRGRAAARRIARFVFSRGAVYHGRTRQAERQP
jgi:MFS family permease